MAMRLYYHMFICRRYINKLLTLNSYFKFTIVASMPHIISNNYYPHKTAYKCILYIHHIDYNLQAV